MKNLDAVPHFIEPGDDQDERLGLPIFVTRQVEEATRHVLGTLKQRLAEEANNPQNG